MPGALAGKVAVVTGAGRGIGRAIAAAYAEAGAAVCCAARTEVEIEHTASEIRGREGKAIAIPTDVTQFDSVRQMFQATNDTFGGVDIVIINAGRSPGVMLVGESDPEEWAATIQVNLVGAYHCAKAAIPHLRARGGGKIITMGSGLGHRGQPGGSAYSCSKAGLWMLTRVLAQELVADRISVVELIPGPVDTAIPWPGAGPPADEWVKAPEDVVPLALFLATQPEIGPTAQSFSLMRRDA